MSFPRKLDRTIDIRSKLAMDRTLLKLITMVAMYIITEHKAILGVVYN